MTEFIVFTQESKFKKRLEFWQDRGIIAEAEMKVKIEGPNAYGKNGSFYLMNFNNRTISSDMAVEELDRIGFEPLPMLDCFDLADANHEARAGRRLVNLEKNDELIDADGLRQALILDSDAGKTVPLSTAWTNKWHGEWFICRRKKTCSVSDKITDLNVVFSD